MANNVWDGTKWVDQDTGNEFVDGVWHSPQGTVFANGQWINPQNGSSLYGAQTAQLGANQNQINAKYNTVGAQQTQLGYGYATNQAQQAQLPYSAATMQARLGAQYAQQGTFGPRAQVIGANQQVNQAQQAQLGGQRGLIGQQQADVASQRSEFEAANAARTNVKDQAAVATAQRYRAAEDARNRTFGITPSAEINAPPGTVDLGQDIAPGVRAKLTTQFEDVSQSNQVNAARRSSDLQQAKLAVDLMGTNVDQARLEASKAGITLEQAQLLVSQAENAAGIAGSQEDIAGLGVKRAQLAEGRAGLDTRQAGLAEDIAGLESSQADLNTRIAGRAPFAGAVSYTDPATGQSSWMTPSEADNLNYQHDLELGTERVPQAYSANVNRDNITATLNGTGGFNQSQAQPTLSAFSEGALANMYKNPTYYAAQGIAPWNAKGTAAFEAAILQTLAAKLKAANKTYTNEQAQSAAQQYLDLELTTRAATRPGGSE